jgi:hypothetical protein
VAADYAAAGDVDPRVGEHLLDVLGLDGIAAYLRPSSDLHPVTRSSSLPNRPTDRLFVDRTHLQTARAMLQRLAEEATPPAESDIDDEFARIVAGFDRDVDEPLRLWPAAEDVTEAAPPHPALDTPPSHPVVRREAEPASSLLDGLDTFGAELPDDEEDYTPPAAPPVPRPSAPVTLGVVGIVGGLILFLKPELLPMSTSVTLFLGFAAVVAGFGTLVWRLRPGGDDDDPEDGARV